MIKIVKNALIEWNRVYDSHQKMQHAYLLMAAVLTLVTGGFTLADNSIKETSLFLVQVLLGVFAVNLLAMAILKAFVFDRLAKLRSTKKSK